MRFTDQSEKFKTRLMGCPPSPEEKQEQNAFDSMNSSFVQSNRFRNEISQFKNLLQKVCESTFTVKEIKLVLEPLIADSNALLGGTHVSKSELRMTQDKDYYEYLGQLSDSASESQQLVKQMETFLCDSRCLFFNTIMNNQELIGAFMTQLEPEIETYQKHREEDKNQWLAWLKDQAKSCEYFIKNNSELKIKSRALLKKINIEVLRTKKLSNAEIIGDTSSFGRNSNEFSVEQIY